MSVARAPRRPPAERLPDFPWDTIAGVKRRAAAHPDGLVDLSVGTPVDPTPELGRRALAEAADAPGYPKTTGTEELREAIVDYLTRRWGARDLGVSGVLPVIGTKELVAGLPLQLGLGVDHTLVIPATAYPTYDVGARLAGCRVVAAADLDDARRQLDGRPADLVWLNSPSNPTGQILSAGELRAWVEWAREVGAIVASDECYAEFAWEAPAHSVLDPAICGGTHTGLLACHSLSKRSNLAGYRAGFVAGDPDLVGGLLAVRKHAGLIVPDPVQHAMAVLLGDDRHVEVQRERYRRRRALLRPALEAAGFRIDHSQGSIYLWATRGEDGRATLDWLAARGILGAAGDFYGEAGRDHVRLSLTAADERIEAAAHRLAG